MQEYSWVQLVPHIQPHPTSTPHQPPPNPSLATRSDFSSQASESLHPHQQDSKYNLVQLLSHVRFFVTPWTAAHQASLSITNSQFTQSHCVGDAIQPSHPLSSDMQDSKCYAYSFFLSIVIIPKNFKVLLKLLQLLKVMSISGATQDMRDPQVCPARPRSRPSPLTRPDAGVWSRDLVELVSSGIERHCFFAF